MTKIHYDSFVDLKYKPKSTDVICQFKIVPSKGFTFREICSITAGESSVGTWTDVKTMNKKIGKTLSPKVFYLNKKENRCRIAYPIELFEMGNLPCVLSSIGGNIYGMKSAKQLYWEDIKIPKKMLKSFKGPQFGIRGIRKYLNVYNRPLVGTIVKPKVGLTSSQHAKVAYESWVGGCDIVKDDENLLEVAVEDVDWFDVLLGDKTSTLIDLSGNVNMDLIKIAKSSLMGDVFNSGMFNPSISRLREIYLTFATKLSHTADSQRQRHRRTPSRVINIADVYKGGIDFVTPLVIRENPQIKRVYEGIMDRMFNNVEEAIGLGIPREIAVLLLPNAMTIRIIESGDLFDWITRWKQRLCFLAQEEIFFASVGQVEDVLERMPQLSGVLLAPCGIRQAVGISPRCPEGDRWCGQPVYNWQIGEYSKKRLI